MSARQNPQHVSKRGLAWIVAREGVRLTAYPDPGTHGAPWTIGVGHTGPEVKPGMKITLAAAYRLLRADCAPVEAELRTLELPDRTMFDAMVSAGINLGRGVFDVTHDLGRELHARRWGKAADALLEYDRDMTGKVLTGLRSRRMSERAQFLRGLARFRKRQQKGGA